MSTDRPDATGLREAVEALARDIERGVAAGYGGDRAQTLVNIATELHALAAHPEPEADPTAGERQLRPSFGRKPEGECVVALEDLPAEPDAGDVEALAQVLDELDLSDVASNAMAYAVLVSDWLAADRAATAERALTEAAEETA